jgi:hypothetical protein
MAEAWSHDDAAPRWGLSGLINLGLEDESFIRAAQAKVRAGFKLTDPELMRLLQCELPEERELELQALSESMTLTLDARARLARERNNAKLITLVWVGGALFILIMALSAVGVYG